MAWLWSNVLWLMVFWVLGRRSRGHKDAAAGTDVRGESGVDEGGLLIVVAADGLVVAKRAIADIQLGADLKTVAENGTAESDARDANGYVVVAAYGLVVREAAAADGKLGDEMGKGERKGKDGNVCDGAATADSGEVGSSPVITITSLGQIAGELTILDGGHPVIGETTAE